MTCITHIPAIKIGGKMNPKQKPTLVLLATLLVFCFLTIQPSPATAQGEITIYVDSTEDKPDAFLGNNTCSVDVIYGGPCTLRAAISEANTMIANNNVTILVTPGIYTLTIPPGAVDSPNDGDLDILTNSSTNRITIKPAAPGDVIIKVGPNFKERILEIGLANVTISDIIFTGSNLVVDSTKLGGGAIYNKGTLRLEEAMFTANSVSCMPGENCVGKDVGGAILNHGELVIYDSIFAYNSADRGSAIFSIDSDGETSIYISRSVFMYNSKSTIYNRSATSILNSTFSGDPAGGTVGIINALRLFLRSNTFVNFSETIRNIINGYVYANDNIFTTQASKLFEDYEGTWHSNGYNIFSDDSWLGNYAEGDLPDTNPMLGPLGNYGGQTFTHPLLEGSPAIDHRPGKCLLGPGPLHEDQRHFPRIDGFCDTGAFEVLKKMQFLPFIRR